MRLNDVRRGRPARRPEGLRPVFLARSLLYGTTTGLYLSGTAVFFLRYAGLSAREVAVGLSIGSALSAALRVPTGVLADRLGSVRAWLLGTAGATVAFATYSWIHGYAAYVIATCVVSVFEGLILSGASKYFGEVFPDGSRARGNAYLRATANIGMAVGTAIAGGLTAIGTPAAYLSIVWVYVVVSVLDFVIIAGALRRVGERQAVPRPRRKSGSGAWRDRRFIAVTLVGSVFALNGPMLSTVIPLWILTRTSAPPVMISVVMVINMLLVVVFQVRAARDAETLGGAVRVQQIGAICLAACCALLGSAARADAVAACVLLVLAALAITGGELLSSASSWGISYKLAPADRRGEYLALYTMGGMLAWAVGPVLLTTLALLLFPAGWALLAAVFVLAGACNGPIVRAAAATLVVDGDSDSTGASSAAVTGPIGPAR